MRITGAGLVGIATSSPGAMLQANTTAAATKGLIVKGFTSQSANLQEWQDSSGNVLNSISSNGYFTISPVALTGTQSPSATITAPAHTALTASTESTDVYWNLARTVQFATGAITLQRAVRIGAPTYAFVAASTITNAATMQIDSAPVAGTNATINNAIALRVLTGVSTGRGIIVQGAVSQARNLQEWQNSNGAALGYITSSGNISFSRGNGGSEAFGDAANASGTSATALGYFAVASGTETIALGYSSSASASTAIALGKSATASASNAIAIGTSVSNSTANSVAIGNSSNTLNAFYGTLRTYMPSAATTGAIIKAFTSQTANLQEWQDSAGNVLASIGANGSPQYTSNSPAGYTANQDNLVLTGSAFQRLSGTAARDITGVAPPTGLSHVGGRMMRIYNVGSFNLTLKHNSTSSTAANRFFCVQSADVVIATNDFAELIYDSTNNGSGAAGWRVA